MEGLFLLYIGVRMFSQTPKKATRTEHSISARSVRVSEEYKTFFNFFYTTKEREAKEKIWPRAFSTDESSALASMVKGSTKKATRTEEPSSIRVCEEYRPQK